MNVDALNIGCGGKPCGGYINLDLYAVPGVDIRHDLDAPHLPFRSDVFEAIVARFVLEHLERPTRLLEEIYRVGRHGCRVTIVTPYWNSVCVARDITHRRGFHENNFYSLDPTRKKQKAFYPKCRFRLSKIGVLALDRHHKISHGGLVAALLSLARFVPNIVRDLVVDMVVEKP